MAMHFTLQTGTFIKEQMKRFLSESMTFKQWKLAAFGGR
jgi:hypothetical protein